MSGVDMVDALCLRTWEILAKHQQKELDSQRVLLDEYEDDMGNAISCLMNEMLNADPTWIVGLAFNHLIEAGVPNGE